MRSSKHNIFHLIKLSFHLIKLINIILSTIFFRFSVLHYASRKRKVNDNRTLAIKFRTGGNKTFSEFYCYLYDSFGFIESWVVQSDRKKGDSSCSEYSPSRHNRSRLSAAWLVSARINLYTSTIYRKMGKGWCGIASHQETPCGSSIYRLRGRPTRLLTLAT